MVECFFYGNRLKAQINTHDKENCYEVILYKTKKEIYKKLLIFDSTKTQNENYLNALKMARDWLNTCKY